MLTRYGGYSERLLDNRGVSAPRLGWCRLTVRCSGALVLWVLVFLYRISEPEQPYDSFFLIVFDEMQFRLYVPVLPAGDLPGQFTYPFVFVFEIGVAGKNTAGCVLALEYKSCSGIIPAASFFGRTDGVLQEHMYVGEDALFCISPKNGVQFFLFFRRFLPFASFLITHRQAVV